MVPSNRKVSKDLFKELMQKGRSFHSAAFSMRILKRESSEPFRVSVVVAKKIDKRAVERNVIKRRVYSLLSPALPAGQSGVICAFFMKKKVPAGALPSLKEEILAALRNAGALK